MTPEQYEELLSMLAELIVFIRGECVCPTHEHVSVVEMTQEGGATWHGPWCEVPELASLAFEADSTNICEFHALREHILERAYETLGTRDMSRFLV
jgi:hypothetical protein